MAQMPRAIYDEMVRHALDAPRTTDDLREEVCGLIAAEAGGGVSRLVPIDNIAGDDGKRGSPYRYVMAPLQVMRAQNAVDDEGGAIWGVYHSHIASPARLSPTDLRAAFFPPGEFETGDLIFPGAFYIVVSRASDPPEARAYRVQKGRKANGDPVDPIEEPIELI